MTTPHFAIEGEGLSSGNVVVRLARSRAEIEAAQRLRYEVFYRECGATASPEMERAQAEFSDLDWVADHLIVVDTSLAADAQVVGNYRLLRNESAQRFGKFYSQDEFNIAPLLATGENLLELGRSCVHKDYRTRPVLELLWQGIAEYVMHHDVRYLFGCPSFVGTTDPDSIAHELSYLYHHHLAPPHLRVRTLDPFFVPINRLTADQVDVKRALAKMPPLLKSYLRIGVMVGEGAFIDHQFNSVDVFVTFDMAQMTERYKRHYERAVGGQFKGPEEFLSAADD